MLTPLMYLRAAGLVILLAVFLWGAVVIRGWRNDSLRLDEAEAAAAAQVAEARRVVESMKAAQEAAYAASEGFQREIQELRSRPAVSGPVRLCVPAGVPRTPAAPSGPGPAPSQSGLVPHRNGTDFREGPDIAADLDAFARKCEAVAAQGRALQEIAR